MSIEESVLENVWGGTTNSRGQIAFWGSIVGGDHFAVFTPDHRVIGPGDFVSGIPVERVLRVGNVNAAGDVTTVFASGTWPTLVSHVALNDELLFSSGDTIGGHEITRIEEARTTGDNSLVLLGTIRTDGGTGHRLGLFAGNELVLAEGQSIDGHVIVDFMPDFEVNIGSSGELQCEFSAYLQSTCSLVTISPLVRRFVSHELSPRACIPFVTELNSRS